MLLNMYRKCYAKIENNSQKQVVAIVLFRGYTLRLLMLWVSSFYRICFWKASGGREPLAPTIFTFLPKPLLCKGGVYTRSFLFIPVKTMTASAVWQSRLRGV